ncbi:hypothetical protein QTI99_06310 [Clostridium perfringens]|uniref:hypothetical protein n=1 Tax=Clostridium perfringens TaxID=1502 RepID=UPI00290E442E|nr:hypothetical protein [Clostridium perfringens]EJT6170734.1 hypothetical protein [Clostridium perfringens]EJT6541459.1 hypothetical protein [Clostridium perfringens]EJT6566466.1 hypothetical protein [Clostridium perfringens]MBS5994799.1 hypothetical protein [Clostridium perfringens]MDM0997074.1 hypothetical protein [Clostridium perfringens]
MAIIGQAETRVRSSVIESLDNKKIDDCIAELENRLNEAKKLREQYGEDVYLTWAKDSFAGEQGFVVYNDKNIIEMF